MKGKKYILSTVTTIKIFVQRKYVPTGLSIPGMTVALPAQQLFCLASCKRSAFMQQNPALSAKNSVLVKMTTGKLIHVPLI